MSSEQMRIELEAFVNIGLQEGWRGWPLKGQADGGHGLVAQAGAGWRIVCRSGRSQSMVLIRRQGRQSCRFCAEN